MEKDPYSSAPATFSTPLLCCDNTQLIRFYLQLQRNFKLPHDLWSMRRLSMTMRNWRTRKLQMTNSIKTSAMPWLRTGQGKDSDIKVRESSRKTSGGQI